MVSIVIPAHNEERSLARCLSALTDEAEPDELEIFVVCNGCTDATAKVAHSFGPPVRVLETDVASKVYALNLGDRAASSFPRFYVDADVVLPLESLRQVSKWLETGQIHGAVPRMRVDLNDHSAAVRAYYAIWLQLPYARAGRLGSGVYAISEQGRRRFDVFPEIFAEDSFIDMLFDDEDRVCVEEASFLMTPPRTLRHLIRIESRRLIGKRQLKRLHPEKKRDAERRQRQDLIGLVTRVRLWPALAVYLYVKGAASALYWLRRIGGRPAEWTQDESSR